MVQQPETVEEQVEALKAPLRPLQDEAKERTNRILRKISQTGIPAVKQEDS